MPSCPNEIDLTMMRRALTLARQAAEMGEVPVGAVIYRRDQILAQAHNLRESQNDPTAHAEIVALRQAALTQGHWRLQDCSIAVTLEPCPMCAGALVNARIARLVYGPDDPKMGCVQSLHRLCDDARFNHRLTIIPGLYADESATLLKAFFAQRRRKPDAQTPQP